MVSARQNNDTPWLSRWTLSWALYDFANSAYALLITGVAYQIYFKKVIFVDFPTQVDFWWGLTIAASITVSALLSPFVGVAGDIFGYRKRLFWISSLIAIVFTALLYSVHSGNYLKGVLLFFVANSFYNLSLFLYDSFLKVISSERDLGNISGFGWGVGYLGGLTCLAITYPLFTQEPSPGHTDGFRYGFLAVALFYFVFSLPAFYYLPASNGVKSKPIHKKKLRSIGGTVSGTIKNWRSYKEIGKFLLAYYCVTEAIMTTIFFTANYLSTTFGLSTKDILILTIIVQLIGFPASWMMGAWGDRWKLKKMLNVSIGIWMVLIGLMIFGKTRTVLYVIVAIMGLVIGSTQALGRAVLTKLSPLEKVSEMFGFNSLSSKVAATVGPLLFGIVSSATGNQRIAWLSLLPFLIIGLILIWSIREETYVRVESME